MFHLQYSQERDFLTWDELGCLSRSLGFQVDLFRCNVTDEINYDDRGLHIQEVYRVLEYKLLHKSLHLTFNIHTDTWNVAALKKAVSLVEHKAFTFEQLHCIRVAYQLYEHQDSKGMLLQQRVILRTLKMCGRTIAPLKLMHRLKHMKGYFVEGGRIQLDEFLDLILWCDIYEGFQSDELIYSRGMDNDLFKLVAFDRMLTHHDQRLSERLNSEYMADEWDFGQESLGSKRMFKEPPVNDQIRVQQVQKQRAAFHPLRTEVDRSQHRVYRSRVGFVRPRPLTAPDLTRYGQTTASSNKSADGTVALSAYEIMQKLRRKPPSSADASKLRHTEPFQPIATERKHIPSVVTADDVTDAANKLHDVMFQMETLEVRYEYEMKRDLGFLLPHYTGGPRRVHGPDSEIAKNNPNLIKKKSSKISLEGRIDQLVHPRSHASVSHSRTCDARHRGWHAANTNEGRHYILSSPTHHRSPQAHLHQRLFEKSSKEIRHLHGSYLYRHTPSQQDGIGKARRPSTAPSTTNGGHSMDGSQSDSEETKCMGDDMYSVQAEGTIRGLSEAQPLIREPTIPKCTKVEPEKCNIPSNDTLTKDEPSRDCPDPLDHASSDERIPAHGVEDEKEDGRQDVNFLPPPSADAVTRQDELTTAETSTSKDISKEKSCLSPPPLPVPYMKHSKPAVVEVGQIGKISLLENIAESRFYESVAESSGIKKSKITNGSLEPSAKESRGDHSVDNGIVECDLKTVLTETATSEQESSHITQIDAEAEEEQKLRAIAMLRIYTHRLATPRRGSKRWKQSSRSVAGERRSVSARCSRPSGANRCGRVWEEDGYRRVTKSAHDKTRKMINVLTSKSFIISQKTGPTI
ncbi:uncharacterized protein LOC135468891 [Liolophura sinensis]|uniref:uncharacterized protein LOC135468891 n=1 Tax=Liolophura sinensis TaxID=3198878 RepID=UPI0031588BD4